MALIPDGQNAQLRGHWAESEDLARRLAHTPLGQIHASPLRRAAQTALLVAGPHATAVRHDPALIEIDYGAWEGLTQPEVKHLWPELLRQWKRTPDRVRFPGGESFAEARERMRGFLHGLAAGLVPGITVAVVTHQIMIRLVLLEATGRPAAAWRGVEAATATPHCVTFDGGQFRISSQAPEHCTRTRCDTEI